MRKVIRALHAEEQATSTSKETEKKLRLFRRDDPLMKNSNYQRIDEQGVLRHLVAKLLVISLPDLDF